MASALTFRLANHADIELIRALVHSAYRGDVSRRGWTTEADLLDGQRTDPAELQGFMDSPHARIVLAFEEARLVASVLMALEESAVYVGMFAVEPALQGRGIGRAILAEVERRALEDGVAHTLRMTVIGQRAELIAWYGRRGFLRTGERRAFPYGDPRFGLPLRDDLYFEVLEKPLR
jgi:ribosomal protein S18 acetylase RimI-like enzyme